MPLLETRFHLIAPDMIGFGQSAAPDRRHFNYTFENLTEVIERFLDAMAIKKFYLYVFDFFFNDTAPTEIYTLALHDALPIWISCIALPGMIASVHFVRAGEECVPLSDLCLDR